MSLMEEMVAEMFEKTIGVKGGTPFPPDHLPGGDGALRD